MQLSGGPIKPNVTILECVIVGQKSILKGRRRYRRGLETLLDFRVTTERKEGGPLGWALAQTSGREPELSCPDGETDNRRKRQPKKGKKK